jgi:histidinol dehydrogenase
VQVERLEVRTAGDARAVAAQVRGLVPDASSVADEVAAIVQAVRARGDAALDEHTRKLDTAGREPPPLAVSAEERRAALARLPADLRVGLETAIENVTAVARAGLRGGTEVELRHGHRILLREHAVRRAAVYVPGGRAPYPSTVVMGAVTARVAEVDRVVVCSPPTEGGPHTAILAACELCGVDEVYRMGGAQAIAALAYGTESVPRVDVVAGPGNLYVQEAKRLVSADVGIDGFAGPSDLVVVAGEDVAPALVALDLAAQAEHGPGTVVAAVCTSGDVLDAVGREVAAVARDRAGTGAAGVALVRAGDEPAALAFAEAFAPEHLQLVGNSVEALAGQVRNAGCLFVGPGSGTAFGDYVAGSNHVLPTGGAARFASALSVDAFRRRMAQVEIGHAAPALAAVGAPIAEAEGFVAHAHSMRARAPGAVGENGRR